MLDTVIFFTDYDLLHFDEIGNIAILINASVKEPCASTLRSSPCNQHQVELALDTLLVDKALHEVGAPELADVLRPYLLEHIMVPREVLLDVFLGIPTLLFVELALTLQVRGEVVVVREVEAFLQVRLDLGHHLLYLFHVVLLGLVTSSFIFLFLVYQLGFLFLQLLGKEGK